MKEDHYNISSNFRPNKSASQCNVKEFFEMFEDFYTKVLMKKTPDLPHKMCDPYGFALLCNHYNFSDDFDLDASCHDNFKKNKAIYSEYKSLEAPFDLIGSFPFNTILNYLHIGYWFDKKLAIDIFNAQQSPLSIFKQIMALILSVVIIGLGICETKNFIFANAADTNISDNSIFSPTYSIQVL